MGLMAAIHNLVDWFTLADYEKAKRRATDNVAARYARGNINLQKGAVLDEKAARELSKAGDAALARLNRRARRQALIDTVRLIDRVFLRR